MPRRLGVSAAQTQTSSLSMPPTSNSKQHDDIKLTSKRMTFLTSPNFSHSVRRSSRYSFNTSGSSYTDQCREHTLMPSVTECVCVREKYVCVHMCIFLHLKVTGMEHIPNDDDFFMPLPHFSLLLWPPVQLPAQTKTQWTGTIRRKRGDEAHFVFS